MKTGYSINYSYYEKNSSSVSQWIDYLRLTSPWKLDLSESLWIDIDNDNSNFAIIPIWDYKITLDKTQVKGSGDGYKFSTEYLWNSVPLFMVRYFKWRTITDFYGSFFRLVDIQYFPSDFLLTICKSFDINDNSNITRLDYRLDFFSQKDMTIQSVSSVLKHNINLSSIRSWKKWQVLTNWQCWDKNSKAVVFRLYNKLLDSNKKWKDFLYNDYFRFNSVHRLEFECDLKFCKWFKLFNLSSLVDKVINVFWIWDNKRIWKILYRYDKNKLVFTRREIALYHSSIYKNVSFLVSNYIASNYDKNLNPMNIIFDYINMYNWNSDNLKLSKKILFENYDLWWKLLKSRKPM